MYLKNMNNFNVVDLSDKLQDSYKLFFIANVLTSNHLVISVLKIVKSIYANKIPSIYSHYAIIQNDLTKFCSKIQTNADK